MEGGLSSSKNVIEYSTLDFAFANKPGLDSFMGIDSRGTDFFVVDQRGYGVIFKKMADDFKDKVLLNKIVKSISYSRYGVSSSNNHPRRDIRR